MHGLTTYNPTHKFAKRDPFAEAVKLFAVQVGSNKELTYGPKIVGLVLSSYFNRKNYFGTGNLSAWPSNETLAYETGMTERGVRKALRQLELRGHIKKVARGGRFQGDTARYQATLWGNGRSPYL
jgi:hypothetical protein